MPTPVVYPERFCLACGVRLVPRVFPSGQREGAKRFAERVYCNQGCAAIGRRCPRALLADPQQAGTLLVPLTRGLVARIDATDAPLVAPHAWYVGEKRGKYYAYAKISGQRVPLHRWLLDPPPEDDVDHIDGDGLNCTRNNLRLADNGLNRHNSRLNTNNQSGYRGVAWHAPRGRWQASISYHKQRHYLGLFDDPAEAARAVDAALRSFYGPTARLNFPDD